MNILLLSPYVYPDVGGLETYVFELANELAKKSHKITIVSSLKNKAKIKYNENISVKRIPYNFKISNTPICLNLYFVLSELHKKNKFDIIISHTPVPFFSDIGMIFSKANKIPHIIFYHCGGLLKGSLVDILSWIYEKTFQKITLTLADKVVVLNPFVEKYLRLKNVDNVQMGFNLPEISKEKLEKNVQNRSNKIIFVGKLEKSHNWKGVDYLIKAMKIVQSKYDYELTVVGDGNMKNYYKNLAKNLSVKCNFIDEKNNKELSFIYKDSKILVLPSFNNAESFGRVIIEAASYGVPAIGSKIGGIPHVIKDKETGLLVQPKDIKGLAKSITYLIENEKKYIEMSKNAYNNSKNYSWNQSINEISKLIKNVTNKT